MVVELDEILRWIPIMWMSIICEIWDVREASMSEVNGNPTINSDTAARARMDRHVFEKVALWAATGEVTVARRRTVNTFRDGKFYYLFDYLLISFYLILYHSSISSFLSFVICSFI